VEDEEGRDRAEWFTDAKAAICTRPEVSAVVVPSGKNGFDVGSVLLDRHPHSGPQLWRHLTSALSCEARIDEVKPVGA
jgi:hypothetical protein